MSIISIFFFHHCRCILSRLPHSHTETLS